MVEQIRMNQKIPRVEDPELYEYLSQFNDRGRAYQARKLMLLGLVQLGKLNGGEVDIVPPPSDQTEVAAEKDEFDLISEAGVADLF